MVTAPLQVWESYIQVMWVSSYVSFLLTISYAQSHPKAKKFMTKLFPLYDDLVELCDAVIAMGAGAFRGTGDTSTEQDAEGSDVEGEELYEEWAVHVKRPISQEQAGLEGWDIEEPMVCLSRPSLNHWLILTDAYSFRHLWG